MSANNHRGSRRRLSAEERALWHAIARSVKPLRKALPAPADDETSASAAAGGRRPPSKPAARSSASAPSAGAAPKRPPVAPIPRRETQKLARGRAAIDARIDLHGMTQAQAHAALMRFLRRAQADGATFALVITGKGMRTGTRAGARGDDGERGVLRRKVPLWLALPEFRDVVVGFSEAHIGHGGEGALYVRLRRKRS
jgi:DNA-nicking Smr family endonuclease